MTLNKKLTDNEKNKIISCIDWCIRDGLNSEDEFKQIKDKLKNPQQYYICELQGSYHKKLIYNKKSNINVCVDCLKLLVKFQ